MSLFGSGDSRQGIPDHSMQEVLDATQKLGLTPPWFLSPEEARKQPTPADGAKQVIRRRGLDPNADLGIATKDFEIPGPGGRIAAGDTSSPSYLENADAKPLNKPFMEWFFQHALDDSSQLRDPRIDLVNADLSGLPPTTIIAAEIDPLRSEGKRLADRLEEAGNDVGYTCYEGVAHEFFGMGLVVKDAAAAQGRVAMALKKGLRHGVLGKIADALS